MQFLIAQSHLKNTTNYCSSRFVCYLYLSLTIIYRKLCS